MGGLFGGGKSDDGGAAAAAQVQAQSAREAREQEQARADRQEAQRKQEAEQAKIEAARQDQMRQDDLKRERMQKQQEQDELAKQNAAKEQTGLVAPPSKTKQLADTARASGLSSYEDLLKKRSQVQTGTYGSSGNSLVSNSGFNAGAAGGKTF